MSRTRSKRRQRCPNRNKAFNLRRFGIKSGSRPMNTRVSSYQFCYRLTSAVNYALDANGNMTTDGLRSFDYDESNRLSKVKITKNGEAAKVNYLHNTMGQRVFKGEPKLDTTLPNEPISGS